MARRGSAIHSIDQSWQKWKPCDWCGRPFCVNNYEDHRTRVPKYKGLVTCAFCYRLLKEKRLRNIVAATEGVARIGCLRTLAKTGKTAASQFDVPVYRSDCKCASCVAQRALGWDLLEGAASIKARHG